MIVIDGRDGEGGGQVLRSALALSAITGMPLRVHHVRGGRSRPGLLRQHLTALRAAQRVCAARISGDVLGSDAVEFTPGPILAGDYEFDIGSAGSTGLVVQTVLPILLAAKGPSRVRVSGGTHNASAPPFEFIDESFLPCLRAIGHDVHARIERYGYYPAGGGCVEVSITPARTHRAFELLDSGEAQCELEAAVANLPQRIAARELAVAGDALNVDPARRHHRTRTSVGPGNVLLARLRRPDHVAVMAEFGARGVSAERVAKRLAKAVQCFLGSDAAVTEHLADQLLLPLVLGAGGRFTTTAWSLHARTNADVIARFLGDVIRVESDGERTLCTVVAA